MQKKTILAAANAVRAGLILQHSGEGLNTEAAGSEGRAGLRNCSGSRMILARKRTKEVGGVKQE